MLLILVGPSAAPAWGEYDAKGRRDPFVPLLTREGRRIHPPGSDGEGAFSGAEGLRLEGIVFDPGEESYAILDGQLVREGEEVGGVRVLEIGPDSVTVLSDGEPQELRVQHSRRVGVREP